MTKYLINIIGPTAIGKTALSIQLAHHFKADILSADSRQFYKEMSIGTAVPSEDELHSAPHHFIQHKSIHDSYSVGDFETDAIQKIQELHTTEDYVILVGGSGLYTNAVVHGLDDLPNVDSSIRTALNSRLSTEGLEVLQNQLKDLDPVAFTSIAIDNPKRVIRALEVCLGTNKPYSSFLTNTTKNRPFKTISIGIYADREVIYNRINTRVDLMMASGLLEEAKKLLPFKHLNALNTVGYKELFNYLDGNWSLEFAISEIKKNTRRFAKRQLTWNRKDASITWFDFKTPINDIVNYIEREN